MPTVDEGIQTQLRNIEKNYCLAIDELVAIIATSGLTKHPEVVAMLKQRYGMTHGAAHRVSLVARSREERPATAGPGLNPALEKVQASLLGFLTALGEDVEQAPKKGYVSFRRRKQFAMLLPGAKWINVGVILAGKPPTARLEPAAKWNALFTHRVRVAAPADVDRELKSWIRAAYDAAG